MQTFRAVPKSSIRQPIARSTFSNMMMIISKYHKEKHQERVLLQNLKAGLSQDILSTFYSIKEIIRHIRNPQSYRNPFGKTSLFEIEGRYNNYINKFEKIESLRYRVIDQLPLYRRKKAEKVFKEPRTIISEIIEASRVLQLTTESVNYSENISDKKKRLVSEKKFRDILYRLKGDKIDIKVNKMISEIEKVCNWLL